MLDTERPPENSYKQILRSSTIIGGASIINILIGLLRMKVVALLLGPAGIGLIGILQNLMATASTISAVGFEQVGTRQIAEANGRKDQTSVDAARRALFWGTMVLAVVGAWIVLLSNDFLAKHILGAPKLAGSVSWIAIGVALTVATGSQRAILTGMRRIGDIAKVTIITSLVGTIIGIGSVYWLGDSGIAFLVVATPGAGFIINLFYVNRLPSIKSGPTPVKELIDQWQTLVRLGAAFMLGGVAITLGQLAVRSMVQQQLGAENLGYFQASWLISTTYIGFVLSAMGTDYYPRLAAIIHDPERANSLVNDQTEVAILLAGPVILAMLAFAPWIIDLLYTDGFGPTVTILRWQILGDVLKIISWPLGFIILASGKGTIFMLKEVAVIGVFVVVTWFLIPYFEIEATGAAYFLMYGMNVPLLLIIVRALTGFSWESRVIRDIIILLSLSALIAGAGYDKNWLGAVVGGIVTLVFGTISLIRLAEMSELGGPVGRVLNKLMKSIG